MGNNDIRVSVDTNGLAESLNRKIAESLQTAGDKMGREMVAVQKQKIRRHDAIFTHELLNSFNYFSMMVSNGDQMLKVWNWSDHAPYQDRGATYTTKKPPVSSLLPWVSVKLSGWDLTEEGLVPRQ